MEALLGVLPGADVVSALPGLQNRRGAPGLHPSAALDAD